MKNSWIYSSFSNPSTALLLGSNIITIVLALSQHWSIEDILWTYWLQSIAIGVFNTVRILNLKDFETTGFKVNGKSVKPTKSTKYSTASFFMFHYGFFHVVYAVFIISFAGIPSPVALLGGAIFLANHSLSYIINYSREKQVRQNIGSVMFTPYPRIIPMHLISMLLFALPNNSILLVLFLAIKTVADLVMHGIQHHTKPIKVSIN